MNLPVQTFEHEVTLDWPMIGLAALLVSAAICLVVLALEKRRR